jgi:hypothetical protein
VVYLALYLVGTHGVFKPVSKSCHGHIYCIWR